MTDEQNIIFIGRKPIFSYVMACITQFKKNKSNKIHLRARGRTISRCVDCAEILRIRYLEGQIEIESITTDTEKITTMEGETNNVSSIEIIISKKEKTDLIIRQYSEKEKNEVLNKKEDTE